MPKLVSFHLYNDFSGSPKVLKMVLEGLVEKGYDIDLITSSGGVLDALNGKVNLYSYKYHFSKNPVWTMLKYIGVQLYTFLLAFRYCFKSDVTFYINTLLPVAPALAGRLMGKKVIYHYHENAQIKGGFYKLLAKCMQCLADEIICVSDYQSQYLYRKDKIRVIPNALSADFVRRSHIDAAAQKKKTVLMLSSLKGYKGTKEFIELSNALKEYCFLLVINDSRKNIELFLSENRLSTGSNLGIYDRQSDVLPFYERASLVLNLSDRKNCIETFGMTVLEAMTFGLPVIVPTEGGVAELVENGVNGYKIDVQHLKEIESKIRLMLTDEYLYAYLQAHAKHTAEKYSYQAMMDEVSGVLSN